MVQAILNGCPRVCIAFGAVHGLQEEVFEGEPLVALRVCSALWEDQLQFIAFGQNQSGVGFWADTDPVEVGRWEQSAVGFNANFEPTAMQGGNERIIELK